MPDDGTDTLRGHRPARPDQAGARGAGPVQLIGKLTLNRNPTNYFAETEQVAFHTGHLVPGIEVTNDPLMQGRLFSYLDTQLTRLGGPNFAQLPINAPALPGQRPAARRDAPDRNPHRHRRLCAQLNRRQRAVRGRPRPTAATSRPRRPIEGTAVRAAPASFDDHFSQATMFYRSHDPSGAGPHRRGLHLRTRQGLRAGDQRTGPGGAGQHRRRPVRPGRRRPRPARAERQPGRRCRSRPRRCRRS